MKKEILKPHGIRFWQWLWDRLCEEAEELDCTPSDIVREQCELRYRKKK